MTKTNIILIDKYGFCGCVQLSQQLSTILHLLDMVGEDEYMSETDYEEYIEPAMKLIKQAEKNARHSALYYTNKKEGYEWT